METFEIESQGNQYLVYTVFHKKSFRDRGSEFVEILSYKLWDNWQRTGN